MKFLALLIFKSSIIKKVGYLDEDFGIGGKYGASEEADYVLRFLQKNFNGFYTPTIKFFIQNSIQIHFQIKIFKK